MCAILGGCQGARTRPRGTAADTALRGCLVCGLGVVDARWSVSEQVWSAYSPNPRALGGSPRPDVPWLDGYLGASCYYAVEASGGTLGATAMERPLPTFLGCPRHVLSANELGGLRGWAVISPEARNAKPWEHMDLLRISDELRG